MKTKYTPGTEDGLVGKTFDVEIVGMRLAKNSLIAYPMIREVKLKYKDGKTEWVPAAKFYNSAAGTRNLEFRTY